MLVNHFSVVLSALILIGTSSCKSPGSTVNSSMESHGGGSNLYKVSFTLSASPNDVKSLASSLYNALDSDNNAVAQMLGEDSEFWPADSKKSGISAGDNLIACRLKAQSVTCKITLVASTKDSPFEMSTADGKASADFLTELYPFLPDVDRSSIESQLDGQGNDHVHCEKKNSGKINCEFQVKHDMSKFKSEKY